jgi:hypothetical protein
LKSSPQKINKPPTQTFHHQQLRNNKSPSPTFNPINLYLFNFIPSILKSSHTTVNDMANTKTTSARRKLLATPTAASQRKGRVSTPPQRLGAGAPIPAAAKKSRGRPKSNGVSIKPIHPVLSLAQADI